MKKQLLKLVSKLVDVSFKDGKLIESQVSRAIKNLKMLPKDKAIWTLSEYLKQIKQIQRQYTLSLETTMPLSPIQLSKIKKIIEKKRKIRSIELKVNPEILGGFKLKIGDEVWDETVLGKIDQLKEDLNGRSN